MSEFTKRVTNNVENGEKSLETITEILKLGYYSKLNCALDNYIKNLIMRTEF